MIVHTDIQIIRQGGKPAFAVVPCDKWLELTGSEDENILKSLKKNLRPKLA